jgi:hypothetical protein
MQKRLEKAEGKNKKQRQERSGSWQEKSSVEQ